MNSWQLRCIVTLVNCRPPTTITLRPYCLSFSTSEMKSLSPPTMTKALMWLWVNAHLEGVERHGDVGAVLVAARGEVALHHADGVLGEEAAVVADALPVAVGDLGDDLATFLDGFEDEADVEVAADGGLDADLDVVEVDEDGDAVAVSVGS